MSADFRDPSMPATAAVQVQIPSSIEVGPRKFRVVDVGSE